MVGDYNMRSIETVQEDILSYNPSITTKPNDCPSIHSFLHPQILTKNALKAFLISSKPNLIVIDKRKLHKNFIHHKYKCLSIRFSVYMYRPPLLLLDHIYLQVFDSKGIKHQRSLSILCPIFSFISLFRLFKLNIWPSVIPLAADGDIPKTLPDVQCSQANCTEPQRSWAALP